MFFFWGLWKPVKDSYELSMIIGLVAMKIRIELNALTSSGRHRRGKRVTKQLKRTNLYMRRTGLASEQPPFEL